MKTEDRKAAVAAYKERKVKAGIFAIRCAGTDEVWVGQAQDLTTIQNRIWFQLRAGNHPQRSLQAACATRGIEGLTFEALEEIEEEPIAFARDAELKKRSEFWRGKLAAGSI